MNYNIARFLSEGAESHPNKDALIFPHGSGWRPTTYLELQTWAVAFATGLQQRGVNTGDRVLVLVKPSVDLYVTLFGLLHLGAVPILADPGMGRKRLLHAIQSSAPAAMVALPVVHAIACMARKTFSSVRVSVTTGSRLFGGDHTLASIIKAGEETDQAAPYLAQHDDEAAIVFTSGSTGAPKGVSFRHGAFAAVVKILSEQYGMSGKDTTVETFAAFALIDIALGATVVIPDMNLTKPATAKPANLLKALTDHEATVAFMSPILVKKTIRIAHQTGTMLPHLRDLLTGVAPVPIPLHSALRQVAPNANLRVNYGATEGLTLCGTDSNAVLSDGVKGTSAGMGTLVGAPMPGIQVAILPITDDPVDDVNLDTPRNVIGEIAVSGSVVSPEYKDNPTANALAKIVAHDALWHRTGDLGRIDDEGRVWFCGRKAHRVVVKGHVLPSVAVEGIFNLHPRVFRTALVGIGARPNQRAVLLIEPNGAPLTSAELGEVLALSENTFWAGAVTAAHNHSSFPVDPRHNAKISREALTLWANKHLGSKK